jgi:hypothetical protein
MENEPNIDPSSAISLHDIVTAATYRRLLIPPLQRGITWGARDQRRLLGSVLAGRPVGALITAREIRDIDGSAAVPIGSQVGIDRLKPGDLPEQVEAEIRHVPPQYVLDGQQRIIALATAFAPATTPHRKSHQRSGRHRSFHQHARIWLLDLKVLLELRMQPDADWKDPCSDFERAIQTIEPPSVTRKTAAYVAKQCIAECKSGKFRIQLGMLLARPGNIQRGLSDLLVAFIKSESADDERKARAERIVENLINVKRYRIPVFAIEHCSALEAASVFERINKSGHRLAGNDVANAHIFVRDRGVRKCLRELEATCSELDGVGSVGGRPGITQYDLLVASVAAGTDAGAEIPALRADALLQFVKLPGLEGISHIDRGLRRIGKVVRIVGEILKENGVRGRADWPVPAVSIAMISSIARFECGDDVAARGITRLRLRRWWWANSLDIRNVGASHMKVADLCSTLQPVLMSDKPPTDVVEYWSLEAFGIEPDKLRRGAQAKALCALMRMRSPRDFRNWSSQSPETPENLHHIFPKTWLSKRNLLRKGDCITNLALISKQTNQDFIGGLSPSEYVKKILGDSSDHARERLSEVMAGHGVSLPHLERDDFESFLRARRRWFDDAVRKLGDELNA